ncbi:MAG: SDR family oxidoreductase, partial [Pseudomonadota bacterium]
MEIRFDDRQVLVTGAVRGIGQALVAGFRASGAVVWAADIEADLLDAMAAPGVLPRVCDVTDPAAVAALVAEIEDAGPLHVAIHAAGGVRSRFRTPVENVTDEDWRVIQAVNV